MILGADYVTVGTSSIVKVANVCVDKPGIKWALETIRHETLHTGCGELSRYERKSEYIKKYM